MSLLRPDPGAFPAVPPTDLLDARVIAEHDWAAFQALDKVTNHWARPGWSDGARAYYWMLAFPHEPELGALALRCQKEISDLGLDPVPTTDGLHITVRRVGALDAVTPAQVEAVAREAVSALPAAFQLRVVPMAGSRGAVRFSVAPWEPLVRLHAALAETSRRSGCSSGKPTASFRPHLSIAYHNRPRAAASVIEAVRPLRVLPPTDVVVGEVHLVELRRQGWEYRWDTLHSLALPR